MHILIGALGNLLEGEQHATGSPDAAALQKILNDIRIFHAQIQATVAVASHARISGTLGGAFAAFLFQCPPINFLLR